MACSRCGLVFVVFLGVLMTDFANSIEYLTNECNDVLYVGDGGGTLVSQSGLNYASNVDCTVIVQASLGRRILLTFEKFDTEGSGFGTCFTDYLEVFDSDMSSIRRLCGTAVPGDITSVNNSLILQFTTDSSIDRTGFSFAYTSFHTGFCSSNEFTCNNGRCIDSDLENNQYDNCGDASDEPYDFDIDIDIDDAIGTANNFLRLGIGIIIAIIIAIIALIVLICVCIGCICFHVCCKTSASQRSNAVVMTSASQQPAGQVAYSQPPPAYGQPGPYGQPTTVPYGNPAAPFGQPNGEQAAPLVEKP
ncbi:abnormal cell migration protein 13-like [Asterias rubens]|uniref:abnormal cell migration protein 13-like n=1 Tax=Asterias rubens TaxID=7604 RepID=UPI001454F2EC|nr:abnormal cell migration protein 13-like [Asterias rubens]